MRNFILIFFAAILLGCNSTETRQVEFYAATNENFNYTGRYKTTEEGVELINSAASAQSKVSGDSIRLFFKSGNDQHHYVSIEIDGEYRGRFRVQDDSLQLSLPQTTENASILKVFKDTEASNGNLIFKGLKAEKVSKISEEDRPKIEFIGNSITCGMGADAREIPCADGEWFDQHNAYLAYGPRVARALNTDFELSCVSGMGMYRNWNDEDQAVMPDVYSNLALNADRSEKADFSNDPPDIVSIALGTNDLSLGDGEKERLDFNAKKFKENYISFIEEIYTYYPNTQVALISSPVLGEREKNVLLESLNEVKNHFKNRSIAVFEFENMEAHGCTSHPDIQDHEEMAQQLIPFYEKLLKQK